MQPIIQHLPLQRLVSGDSLHLHVFTFQGVSSGPTVYLQANLHGPEILGSALLIRLIEYLGKAPQIHGTLTILPQANPIGVQQQAYGFQFGRWNTQNGKDWNRIFQKIVPSIAAGTSVENKLAATLQRLAAGHDFVLDIHTSGKYSVPYVYTETSTVSVFQSLSPAFFLLEEEDDYMNAFDESCAAVGRAFGTVVHAATWEAGTHGTIGRTEFADRFADLLRFLVAVGTLTDAPPDQNPSRPIRTFPLKAAQTLCAPSSGYLVWMIEPGTTVSAGQEYAQMYDPSTGTSKGIPSPFAFLLIAQYPLQAVAEGQELAKIIRLP